MSAYYRIAFAKSYKAYHLGMSRIHPECPGSDPPF